MNKGLLVVAMVIGVIVKDEGDSTLTYMTSNNAGRPAVKEPM